MMTKFGGRKNAFSNGGGKTKFGGRSGFGPMKNVPDTADISGGNRRLTKSNIGDAGGGGTRFSTRTAFGGKRK